ncbi:MAG: hypothetical protein R2774_16120 [Saprospiraceae bacterium]
MKNKFIVIFFGWLALLFIQCNNNDVQLPKQRMYPRVIFPEKSYTVFDSSYCNFTFKYPTYTKILKDAFIFEGKPSDNCWFNIHDAKLNYTIHCSYYPIDKTMNMTKMINDAFYIAGKHNTKANFRKETLIKNSHGVEGLYFDIEGPVASPVQFFLTDGTSHFFRASLYFNAKVNPDSTDIILKFVKSDIDTLIQTFHWK